MKRALLFVGASTALACAQLVGIGDFPGETDSGGADAPIIDGSKDVASSACTNAVITSSTEIDALSLSSNFVFTQAFGVGVGRCAVGTTCTDPISIVAVAVTDTFGYAAIGASLVYSTTTSGGGTIHRAALDGTNDVTLLTTAASPSYVATGGAAFTYWVDDVQPAVHCIGCAGGDAVWIDNVDAASALFADGSAVYVAALDATGVTTGIVGCGANAACANKPNILIAGLPADSLGPTNVASDVARVYAPRGQYSDLVSIDAVNAAVKVLATGVDVTALAVDGTKGELFYGTTDGTVARVKSDGSTTSTTLSTCQDEILALSFDDTNVYALLVSAAQTYVVFSIPR